MNIAVLAHARYPISQPYAGGLEAHTHQLVQQLMLQGHTVTLFAKAGSDKLCEVVPIFRGNALEGHNPLYKRGFAKAMRMIARGDYDLIINNSLNHVPLLHHTGGMPPMITIFHTPPLKRMIKALQQESSDANRTYIAVSDITADQWQEYCLDKIQVVSNGINLSKWTYSYDTPAKTSAVWTGRITPEKGTDFAIKTCIKLGIPLTIAGTLFDKRYFNKVIKPLLKNDLITYIGHVDQTQLNKLYANASVALVTPLWEEPFGLVAIEALGSGTPVATLPNGAVPSIVNESVGAVATSESVDDLAKAVSRALTKDRKTCREYVEQNYTLETSVSNYISLAPRDEHSTAPDFTWQTYP